MSEHALTTREQQVVRNHAHDYPSATAHEVARFTERLKEARAMKIHATTTERHWRNDGKGAHVSQLPDRAWGYLLRRPEPLSAHEVIAEHLEAARDDVIDQEHLAQHFADVARARRCFRVSLTRAEAAWMGARLRNDEGYLDWLTDPLVAQRRITARRARVTQRVKASTRAKVTDLMASPARTRTYGLA